MKRKATARWRVHLTRGWLRTGLSLCALLALLSMLALFTSGGPLPVQIAAVPQGGAVYLLEEWEDLCLLAYGGSQAGSGAVMALDRRTGQAASQTGFSGRLVWAALRGDSVFALEEGENGAVLSQLSLPELNLVGGWALPAAVEERALFDCDGAGRFYYTDAQGSLWFSDLGGEPRQVDGCTGVSFLEVTPQGTAAAFAASEFFWGPSQDPSAWNSCLLSFSPFCLLGEEHFLDQWGGLYQYSAETVEPVDLGFFVDMPYSPLHYALDRDGQFLFPSAGDLSVECATLAGEAVGSVPVKGELLALCGSGVLWQEENAYWFLPIQFYQEPPTPSPEPTPEPTPTPAPSETPSPSPDPSLEPEDTPTPPTPEPTPSPEPTPPPEPTPSPEPTDSPTPTPTPAPTESPSPSPPPTPEGIVQEDSYLLMPQGVTVDTLLAYFAPDAVLIQTPEGEAVTSGRLATGMTAGDYTLVVLGDTDGSGTVSRSDLRRAQRLLLNGESVGGEDPYRRAADLDGDASLTTLDLVGLSHLFGW